MRAFRSVPNAVRRMLARPMSCIVVVLCTTMGGACGGDASPPGLAGPGAPILLIAVDGFEWDVVLPMLREGRLPRMRALMEAGTYGELRSMTPNASPVIWTTIATGYGPARHGIRGFRKRNGERRLLTSNDRRVRAFWNILGDYGRRVATVGWWLTWPVEPVAGVMVAQVNTVAPRYGAGKGALIEGIQHQVHPQELEPELLAMIPDDDELEEITKDVLGRPWDRTLGEVPNRLWVDTLWSIRADAIYQRIALELLGDEEGFDLFAVYFGGPDVVGHRFWRYLHPELYEHPPSQAEVDAIGDTITAVYAHVDEMVGDLVDAAPPDVRVVILSDHGMEARALDSRYAPEDGRKELNSGGHRDAPPCFFVATGPGIRPMSGTPEERRDVREIGSVLDITPTLLTLLGIPVARDFEGRVLTDLIEPEFLAAHPVEYVDTHTPPDWYIERTKPAVERFKGAEQEREEQLRALGYLE